MSVKPASRRHRGRHPDDPVLFGEDQLPILGRAVGELSWLLSRGYAEGSACKLVGDRYGLRRRQRVAVSRCSCGDPALAGRRRRRVASNGLRGREVAIDGLNCIITLETALAGGVVLVGRDGCYRDLSGVHGSYRWVCETPRAIELIGELLLAAGVASARWWIDRPVSNSGRLKALLGETAARRGWPWQVELDFNPDRCLVASSAVVASSDAAVLDRCGPWVNLLDGVLGTRAHEIWRVVLDQAPEEG